MPFAVTPRYYYQITVIEHNGTIHTGVRDLMTNDIEIAYDNFKVEALKAYKGKMEEFDCVQLSVKSRAVIGHLRELKITRHKNVDKGITLPDHNEPIKPRSSGPGKYRGKETPRDKPFREQ